MIKYKPSDIIPKYGCSCYPLDITQPGEDKFYIFGGIYNNQLDYNEWDSGISIATVNLKQSTFSIEQKPKQKETIRSKKAGYPPLLKPKIHYRIERPLR